MATLTQEMKDMIASRQCFVGTVTLIEEGPFYDEVADRAARIGVHFAVVRQPGLSYPQ